jgi:hypothetical protein
MTQTKNRDTSRFTSRSRHPDFDPAAGLAHMSYVDRRPDSIVRSIQAIAVIVSDSVASGERIHQIIGRLSGSPTCRDAVVGRVPRTFTPEASTIERVLQLTDRYFGGPACGS